MARIRTIKPEFYTSGKQLRLSIEAAFLLPSLWQHADDEGRLPDDPLEIGARCPRLIKETEQLLIELEQAGWIHRYKHNGKNYLQIHDFLHHQKINRPSVSKIPPFSERSLNTHGGLTGEGRKEGKERKDGVQRKDGVSGKDSETINHPLQTKPEKKSRFIPPTLSQLTEYCVGRGNSVDPEKFLAYYESVGWRVGRNPMKDWRAAVRTWERNYARRTGTGARVQPVGGRCLPPGIHPDNVAILERARQEETEHNPHGHWRNPGGFAYSVRQRALRLGYDPRKDRPAGTPDVHRETGQSDMGPSPERDNDNRGEAGPGENIAGGATGAGRRGEGESAVLLAGDESGTDHRAADIAHGPA